jgi:predicted SAM-dependent methyltransferase
VKLNLGCGQNRLDGYVNTDREPAVEPDVVMDLEQFPWPFEDDSVDEVVAKHVLEHVGATADLFIGVMQELYRVCSSGALIHIAVPHPRHNFFLDDPTHVRAITPHMMELFSKRNCEEYKRLGASNSPLAFYAEVDFEVREVRTIVVDKYRSAPNLKEMVELYNNIVTEYQIVLEVIK